MHVQTEIKLYLYCCLHNFLISKILPNESSTPPKSPTVESQMFCHLGPLSGNTQGHGPNFSGRVVQRSGQEDLCFSKAQRVGFSCRQHVQKSSDL